MNIRVHETSRFSHLSPLQSRLVLVLFAVCLVYSLLSFHQNPLDVYENKKGQGDSALYASVIQQMSSGAGYYETMSEELKTRGYPTFSLFNWRLPTLFFLLSYLPDGIPLYILPTALAFLTILVWFQVLYDQFSFSLALFGCVLITGFCLFSLIYSRESVSHEFLAGTLIAMSLAAGARNWRTAGLIAGISALLIRELALPYVLLMLVFALHDRRLFEALSWTASLVLFALVMGLHAMNVSEFITQPSQNGQHFITYWLDLGGWSFVLDTAWVHPLAVSFPGWVTALAFPPALLGLIGWKSRLGFCIACTVGFYVLIFIFIGKPFDIYWGLLYAALWPLGLLTIVPALRGLWTNAFGLVRQPAGHVADSVE